MGPRQDAGEDLERYARDASSEKELQWGPGRMPGKTHLVIVQLNKSWNASMGPRQDAGEDEYNNMDDSFPEMLQWGPGRMPGKTLPFFEKIAKSGQLQWGPGRMPGKTRIEEYKKLKSNASMGPRQDAGEDRRSCRNHDGTYPASMGPRQDAGEDI